MKRLILIKTIILFSSLCFSQNNEFEKKAIEYFCDNLEKIDSTLINSRIYFNGKISNDISNVYHISSCINETDLLSDEAINSELLKIENQQSKINASKFDKIDVSCELLQSKKPCFLVRKKLYLTLNRVVQYKEKYFVEITIRDRKSKSERIIMVIFNPNNKEASHCYNYLSLV